MIEFSAASDFEVQRQIDVFSAQRMALVEGHEATPELSQHLFQTVETLALEPDNRNHHGIYSRVIQRAIGRPLVAQINPEGVSGFGSSEEDTAPATVFGIKNGDTRIFLPSHLLSVGVYEIDETIYVDSDARTKILKRITPLHGNKFRDWAAKKASGIWARKVATEEEVQEAVEIVLSAVRYDDKQKSK